MPPGNSAGSLLLEEPLIRTPYELLRRSHRSAQRQVEKDFMAVQSVLNGLLKSFDDRPISQEKRATVNAKLDQGVERVRGLKRKLEDLQPSESQPGVLKARLQYLDAIIASGATDREVEVKIELSDESQPVSAIKEEAKEQGEQAMDIDQEKMVSPVKEEAMDLESKRQAERAGSPLAPEPVHEDKNIARYMVDYLLRRRYIKTAKAVTQSAGIEQLVDMKLFAELVRIETALVEKQSVAEALAWCGENRGTLKKTKNNLEFTLRLQEFIELCRNREVSAAITYSRKNLAPWAASHMLELQQGMTLLAFGEKTGVGLYRRLYDRSRWVTVSDQFRETFLSLYALPSQSLLSLATHAGLSALRLPCCRAPDDTTPTQSTQPTQPTPKRQSIHEILNEELSDTDSARTTEARPPTVAAAIERPAGNVDCPTCNKHFEPLVEQVAMSHHVNSTIVCRISGEVMDSQNEPMAFPNGYVYGSKALREMAKTNFDVVTCPRTKETCAFARLRKVYIS